jgi:chromosome partitioning protein
VNALVAADRVIVPVQTEYFALEGLAGLLDTLALIQRELNPRLTVAGMLLTMHDARTKLAQDVEREVREHFPSLVFDTVIPRNVRLARRRASAGRSSITIRTAAGADAYFELAKEVAARG